MQYKSCLFATSALLAALAGTNAHAQQRPATTSTTTIEELVVTAEKREQNLQDVPVAVSAFTDNKRELVGINSIQDMTNFTPGLTYNSSTDRISLRGVGRLTNVLSGDASVANYNDGIYETFAVQAGRSTLFLDRVEVLRGPQGTLYGRNAIGGAINEISKRPTEDWFAEARATYENYNHYVLEAAVSGPVPFYDKLQWRLAGDWDRQTDGWAKSTIPGAPDEGNVINEWFLEAQLQGKFFDDKLEFWAKWGVGVWHNGAGGPGGGSGGWTPAPFPTYEWGQAGIQLNAGYPCNPLSTAQNVVNVSTQGCTNPAEGTPWSIARVIPYQVRLPVYNTEAIHLTWHAKNFDVRYITGGVTYHYELTGPDSTAGGSLINTSTSPITSYNLISGTNIRPQEAFDYREYNHFWSHEINLVSTWDNPLQYVLGAYYFHQTYRQPVFTTIADQPQWSGPFFLPQVFCFETGGVCAPSNGHRYDNQPQSEATSWAGFGQIDWKFVPDWKLTLGLRYSHDEKEGEESVRLLCFGAATCYGGTAPEVFGFVGLPLEVSDVTAFSVSNPAPGTPLPRGITSFTTFDPATGFASRTYDATWQAWTGTAGIEWQPTPDTNVYAKYSRGYKSGGFYVGIFTFLAPNAWADKETVDSWEIGLKKDFGKRLQTNFAAYYYDYKNLQVPIPVISGTGSFAQVATNFINVPKAVSQGFEAEITWLPIDNLQILFNYSYNDAHVTEGSALDVADPSAVQPGAKPLTAAVACGSPNPANQTDALCDPWTGIEQRFQDLSGSPLPNAPKNKLALNGNYTFRNLWGGDIVASITYIWRDSQLGTLFDRPYNTSPSWSQTDARLTWTSANGKNRVIVYGKNIFNQIGYDGGALGSRFAGFIVDPTKLTTPSGGIIAVNQGVFPTYSVTPPHIFGISFEHKFF